MAKSIKLKNDTYLDSSSVVNGHTTLSAYCYWVDKWLLNSKQIWVDHSTGFNITINRFTTDKMPIIIFGADNSSGEPVFIIIHANSTGGMFGIKQLSGININVTNSGNVYHLSASKYSYYWVMVPPTCEISLATGSL